MAQSVLPNQINYQDQLPALIPGVQNFTQVLQPVNGSTFTQNQQIFIDIPSRGFIDPQSIYIRYKMTVTTTTSQAMNVLGCPLYTPFQRVDTFFNSQIVDSIPDYNLVAHAWSNLYLGVNEKYGNQFGFGYSDPTPGQVTIDELDGRTLGSVGSTGVSYFVSGPIVGTKLTNCEKFIPAFAIGGIRLVFTLDTWANMFDTNTSLDTTATKTFLSNFELVYDLVDFGPEIEQMVMAQPSIMIKSNGYANSSVAVPTGTTGTNTLVFNQRFASIRSAIIHPSATAVGATFVNGKFDSIDITSGGYYSLVCGGVQFPQGGPLSMANNKAGILSELRKATGNLYDWSKSMAINAQEFNYIEAGTNTIGTLTATSVLQPAKTYIGFDLNKLNSGGKNMLNGISSQNSPINVILNIATTTASSKNVYLILNYDCIFMIDPHTKMITINQ